MRGDPTIAARANSVRHLSMERAAAGDGDLLLGHVPTNGLYNRARKSTRFAAVMRRFNVDPNGHALSAGTDRP